MHYSSWPKSCNSRNHQQFQQCRSNYGILALLRMGLQNRRPKLAPALKASDGLQSLQRIHEHWNWIIEEWNCIVWQIQVFASITSKGVCECTDLQRKSQLLDAQFVGDKPVRICYCVADDFMEHIRTNNPHRTILDVCTLIEHRVKSDSPIHDNNSFGGLLHLPKRKCTLSYVIIGGDRF